MAKGPDSETASAMEKLTRRSRPVRVLRRVSALASAKAQLESLCQVAAGDATLPRGLRKLLKLGHRKPSSFEPQIKVLEQAVAILENDWIDGELTPLTETEVWSVRAHFTKMGLYLNKQLVQGGEGADRKLADESARKAIDLIGNQFWISKWIAFSLKRKRLDGELTAYWPDNECPADVEPGTIAQLYGWYTEAFTLTEAELGKSAAPTASKS